MISVSMVTNDTKNETLVTICYPENTPDKHFIVECYDEVLRRWVPYDGKYGIVEKE